MTVSELIYKIDYLATHNMINKDTELILFAEHLPGMAAKLDTLGIDVNSNKLQLFMQYENKHKGKGPFYPLGD